MAAGVVAWRGAAPWAWWLGVSLGLAALACGRVLPGVWNAPCGLAAISLVLVAVAVFMAFYDEPLHFSSVFLATAALSVGVMGVGASLLSHPLPLPVPPRLQAAGLGVGLAAASLACARALPPWAWWPGASIGCALPLYALPMLQPQGWVTPWDLAGYGQLLVAGAGALACNERHGGPPPYGLRSNPAWVAAGGGALVAAALALALWPRLSGI